MVEWMWARKRGKRQEVSRILPQAACGEGARGWGHKDGFHCWWCRRCGHLQLVSKRWPGQTFGPNTKNIPDELMVKDGKSNYRRYAYFKIILWGETFLRLKEVKKMNQKKSDRFCIINLSLCSSTITKEKIKTKTDQRVNNHSKRTGQGICLLQNSPILIKKAYSNPNK